jgi:hypothetical protein
MNNDGTMNAKIYPHQFGKVEVRYFYCSLEDSEVDTQLDLISSDNTDFEYDPVLEDLICNYTRRKDPFSVGILQDFDGYVSGSWDTILEDLIIDPEQR